MQVLARKAIAQNNFNHIALEDETLPRPCAVVSPANSLSISPNLDGIIWVVVGDNDEILKLNHSFLFLFIVNNPFSLNQFTDN